MKHTVLDREVDALKAQLHISTERVLQLDQQVSKLQEEKSKLQ